jgi:hypothetical protein
MAWDFETDPEYQAQLDWADEFVTQEVRKQRLADAREKHAEYLEHEIGNQ